MDFFNFLPKDPKWNLFIIFLTSFLTDPSPFGLFCQWYFFMHDFGHFLSTYLSAPFTGWQNCLHIWSCTVKSFVGFFLGSSLRRLSSSNSCTFLSFAGSSLDLWCLLWVECLFPTFLLFAILSSSSDEESLELSEDELLLSSVFYFLFLCFSDSSFTGSTEIA